MPIKVCRIFNTYGPRMHPNDGRVVSSFIVQALLGREITVFGEGLQTRSFCYVDDLIAGFLTFMATPADVVGPLNLGNPHEFTIIDLARKVIELTGSPSNIVHRPLPHDDPKQRQPDIAKAKELLAWSPQVPLDDGLKRTIPISTGCSRPPCRSGRHSLRSIARADRRFSVNVLVTGGAGYVGVMPAARAPRIDAGHLRQPVTRHRELVRFGPLEEGDILDEARLVDVLKTYRPAAVMHFAAFDYVGESGEAPLHYYRNNFSGALTLLGAMRKCAVDRFVFSSTCAVYGTPETQPMPERLPLARSIPTGDRN
jgi:nucleoside-diphosphate-sugar epimerase